MKQLKTLHYQDSEFELDIGIIEENKTIWLSQNDLAILYAKSQSVISRQINLLLRGVYANNLKVYAKYEKTRDDGKRYLITYYNIDLIIALGEAFRSKKGKCIKAFVDDYFSIKNGDDYGEVIIYNDGNVSLDVRITPQEETVWLTQNQIALLFDTSQQVISYHVKNILEEGEVDEATHKEFLLVQNEGNREVTRVVDTYNLDMILSVGYRVKSKTAVAFRKWVSKVLKHYLIKGYAFDDQRAVITKENYYNLLNHVQSLDARVSQMEKRDKNLLIEDKVILENEVFDALVLINRIVDTASQSIVLIDPYLNIYSLNAFKRKKKEVRLVFLSSKKMNISKRDINSFISQYGEIILHFDDSYHDRYLIIDDNMFYHLGTSINYIGKRFTQISLISDQDIIETLRRRVKSFD